MLKENCCKYTHCCSLSHLKPFKQVCLDMNHVTAGRWDQRGSQLSFSPCSGYTPELSYHLLVSRMPKRSPAVVLIRCLTHQCKCSTNKWILRNSAFLKIQIFSSASCLANNVSQSTTFAQSEISELEKLWSLDCSSSAVIRSKYPFVQYFGCNNIPAKLWHSQCFVVMSKILAC